jgi:hypothetical protein
MPGNDGKRPRDGAAARDELASRLRGWQELTGKSLKELEPVVHVSDSSLSRYLAGRTVPPWQVVEQLALAARSQPEDLRELWNRAQGGGEPTAPAPTVTEPPTRRRDRRILVLAGLFVVVAMVFAAGGFWLGRQTAPVEATQQDACASWDWPPATGAQVEAPARPASADHHPVVSLMTGALHGREVVWAQVSGAAYGDRVWLDTSSDHGATWVQCGPFPVSAATGVSRAHPVGPQFLHRACADTPRAARPGLPRNACTEFG